MANSPYLTKLFQVCGSSLKLLIFAFKLKTFCTISIQNFLFLIFLLVPSSDHPTPGEELVQNFTRECFGDCRSWSECVQSCHNKCEQYEKRDLDPGYSPEFRSYKPFSELSDRFVKRACDFVAYTNRVIQKNDQFDTFPNIKGILTHLSFLAKSPGHHDLNPISTDC